MSRAEIQEIKDKLKQMRSENRAMATENRKLAADIKNLEQEITEMREKQKTDTTELENKMKLESKRLETEVSQRAVQRKERRRDIMSDVRKQTEENKELTAEVKAIQAEIDRIKQIHEAFPSRFTKRKLVQRKTKAAFSTRI